MLSNNDSKNKNIIEHTKLCIKNLYQIQSYQKMEFNTI